jgi:DNA-binding beta-propeller fold protein YncE
MNPGPKRNRGHAPTAFLVAALVGIGGAGLAARVADAGPANRLTNINGTIWVANRGAHTIRGFDATTGDIVRTVNMAPNSQPGDLAYANGKLYVAEEFATPNPAIAIVDVATGAILDRILMAPGSRPHHAHANPDGTLVAFGLFGTDMVALVDTSTDTLLGPWDTNPATTNGRAHAAAFSKDGATLYVASDASNEVIALDPYTGVVLWTMSVPGAHELVIQDSKIAYVSRRTANWLSVIDLATQTYADVLSLPLPDTLQLSANNKRLTVGLRAAPARLAVVDTGSFEYDLVSIGPISDVTTIGGHQWTSHNGRFTFAAYEGGSNPGIAVIDHTDGNQVVQTIGYPTRPHGVDLVPAGEDDEDLED